MKKGFGFLILLLPLLLTGQFQFQGQVSKTYANSEIYLSFVENYRKTSRIYLDQIILNSVTDSLGNFSFEGNNLPSKNGMYRIHVDKCSDESLNKHFLQECPQSLGILFIANNKDTITFPLTRHDQPFCSIKSTNRASEFLLEVDALKEEMILDFIAAESKASKTLNFQKWFKTIQSFGLESQEPLVEIYGYDFLSNRENETHEYYLNDLLANPYYNKLLDRMQGQYPQFSLTRQYESELRADQNLMGLSTQKETLGGQRLILIVIGAIIILLILYSIFGKTFKRKKRGQFDVLSPQERKIASAILEGKSNKEIANEFFISLSTVKTHINSIYKKLGVSTREEILSGFQS